MVDLAVIWFQNDLRVHDHGPLSSGCNTGAPVLPLYIFDPSAWRVAGRTEDEFARLKQTLNDLDEALKMRGTALSIRIGKPADVFAALHLSDGIASLHTHAPDLIARGHIEDSPVAAWARRIGIPYRETVQTGLMGHSLSTHEMDIRWNEYMTQPRHKAPSWIKSADIQTEALPSDLYTTSESTPFTSVLPMGRSAAVVDLNRLLSDVKCDVGVLNCHLVSGTLSYREIYQTSIKHIRTSRAQGDHTTRRHVEKVMLYINERCLGAHKKLLAAADISRTYRAAALPRRRHTARPPALSNSPHPSRRRQTATGQQLSFDWAAPAQHLSQSQETLDNRAPTRLLI